MIEWWEPHAEALQTAGVSDGIRNGCPRIWATIKGFSAGKAAAGAILLGPVGLVGGALGKKTATYYCRECGFKNDYKPRKD